MEGASDRQDTSVYADIETIRLPFLDDYPLYIGLFSHLKNATFLRKQLLEGNQDFEYALIDATSILSVKHVLAAAFRAINDMLHGRLRSRNVHSEIVYSLGANNNITDAFRHFGILDSTTALLVIKVGRASSDAAVTHDSVSAHLRANVEGQLLPFNDENIVGLSDMAKIRKLYKITSADAAGKGGKKKGARADGATNGVKAALDGGGKGGPLTAQEERVEMEAVILGTMAMKGS
ncbi:CGI-121-domain-containing protein [Rhizodiscina lignyota]|uniref:EKC/KEOPS complex subunit CGI121 n=1 Tax=Rhizodiscina lignyota TaxID=1504668 RepID=A0A9P4M5H3_9PEZI|nr:CGI-121-domain-containing protein [Rhizodiscina lignyota]